MTVTFDDCDLDAAGPPRARPHPLVMLRKGPEPVAALWRPGMLGRAAGTISGR